MTKKEKLTKEERDLIPVVRDEYLNRFFSLKFDDNECRDFVDFIYTEICGYKKPTVLILDSPMAVQLAANILQNKENQVWEQIWDQVEFRVEDQVGEQIRLQVEGQFLDQIREQLWNQVGNQVGALIGAQVGAQVDGQIRGQAWNQIGTQIKGSIWDQVWDQSGVKVLTKVRAKVGEQVRAQTKELGYFHWQYYGDISDFGWVAFYDYFNRIGIEVPDIFRKYASFKTYPFLWLTFKNLAICSRYPIAIMRDDNFRLHNVGAPAIRFADDYELWFQHGTIVDREVNIGNEMKILL